MFDWALKTQFKDIPHEFHQTLDKGHGRREIRRHYLLGAVEHLLNAKHWCGLRRVGMIESERRIDGKATTLERRYYWLSLDGDVQRFATAVRSHWGIENQLHWCLDVAFAEDQSRIRSGHAPENMSLMRKIALNLLTQESSAKVEKKLSASKLDGTTITDSKSWLLEYAITLPNNSVVLRMALPVCCANS